MSATEPPMNTAEEDEIEEYESEFEDEAEGLNTAIKEFENEMSRVSNIRAEITVPFADGDFKLIWARYGKEKKLQLIVLLSGRKDVQALCRAPLKARIVAAAALPEMTREVQEQANRVIRDIKEARQCTAAATEVLKLLPTR